MLIVIPVGPSDAPNLHLLTQAITRLGAVEAPILIVSVPSLRAEAESAAASLRSGRSYPSLPYLNVTTTEDSLGTLCEPASGWGSVDVSVSVAITDDEFANGWPVGPDRMFLWTIRYLAEIGNDQPWLWLEPDACPIKEGWDVRLANEYYLAEKPYFGYVRPTAWRDKDGNLTPVEGDNVMLGVAIYPPHMEKDKELIPLLNDLSLPDPVSHPPVPWDIYLRWAFFRSGVHATTVIYDRWRTCNYVRGEFDEIICEPVATEKFAVGGTIPDETLLVHGCKDGSLHKLIIGPVVEVQSKEFVKAVVEEPIKLEVLFKPSKTAAKEKSVSDALETMDQPRLSAIVQLTKLDKKEVKTILEDLGYEVVHAGWIKKKSA